MARGSIRVLHKKGCAASGEPLNGRLCKCEPRVVARLHGKDTALGYLPLSSATSR